MGYHAKLSPSSASRWTECTASVDAQEGLPDNTNAASREGTCCHQIVAEVLEHDRLLDAYVNREMWFLGREEHWREDWPHTDVAPEHVVKVTVEMLDACDAYVEFVREQVRLSGAQMEVEQRVPIGHFTGEEGAGGTSDAVLLTYERIAVVDAKFGRHKVHAYDILEPARGDTPPVVRANLQMACYALGALEKFGFIYGYDDSTQVTMTIVQPFVNHVSTYTCTLAELLQVQEFLRIKAEETRTRPVFKPSADSCHFCKRSGACEAQTKHVTDLALTGFPTHAATAPIEQHRLGDLYAAIPLIEGWVKAVGDRVFQALSAGRPVVRTDGLEYQFVEGRAGKRQWKSEEDAQAQMAKFRLRKEQMFTFNLISPAQAEKLAKVRKNGPPPAITTRQWETLQKLVEQPPPGKSIALATDPRPALASAAEGFGDVGADDDLSDLGL